MSLFANLQHHLIQRAIERGDMHEEVDTIGRLQSVRELLEFEATRFIRDNEVTERFVEVNYSVNFIPLSAQGSYDPVGEAQFLDLIISMSNARALAYANIMRDVSLSQSADTSRGYLGRIEVNALEYRLNINVNSIREGEFISSTDHYGQVYLNHVSTAEIQEIMNMLAPSSIVPGRETPAFLEIAVTRTETYVPEVVEYNTTTQSYVTPIPIRVGVIPDYDYVSS
ncbi:MAG: hypothetical protein N4A31_02860 [Rickettsiales bacterium]|jgi:hypothetical protein|nr:hypothetical protein [Rickettsiales bacterium]